MQVKNVNGSSKTSPNPPSPSTSWLNYWENTTNIFLEESKSYLCPACGSGTTKPDFHGCHVQKVNITDKNWYIVPLCNSCNQKEEVLDIGNIKLAPVPSNL